MHQIITNWSQSHSLSPQIPNEHITVQRRDHTNWFRAGITSVRWPWKFCNSHGRVLLLFICHPTCNPDAKATAKILINIINRHAYLPTALISDRGTAFMSDGFNEVAGVQDNTSKRATKNRAQTIGMHERSHASIKQPLKIETIEWRSLWHKYVNVAVLNYNISYHASSGC